MPLALRTSTAFLSSRVTVFVPFPHPPCPSRAGGIPADGVGQTRIYLRGNYANLADFQLKYVQACFVRMSAGSVAPQTSRGYGL